jgi:hypothetical protein
LAPVSASTAQFPAARRVRTRSTPAAADRGAGLTGVRLYAYAAVAAVAIGAVSLLLPSTPSYDPWAWLVWGREIIHLNLHTTGGPSWKPLPMIFTTLFSLFGGAAPDLWLVVARAGAVLAVIMSFKLAWRVTRDLAPRGDGAGTRTHRFSRLAPLLAGAIAAIGLIDSIAFISDNALGYSEGLAAALLLIAVDRHLDGAPRQAFVAAFFAALDRPEIWVFWVPYGILLLRSDARSRRLVVGLFALIPLLWFGPELWGSGHLLRNVTRALHPRSNSPAFARCPVCTVFTQEAWPALLDRVKSPGIIAIAVAAGGLLRARPSRWGGRRAEGSRGGGWPTDSAIRARASLLAIGLFGLIWWLGIAVETQAGFSGNRRYLVLGTAPVAIAGGVAWGWLVQAAPGWLGRIGHRSAGLRRIATSRLALPASALAALTLFIMIPPWMGAVVPALRRTHGALVYQARLRQDLAAAVQALGRRQILACGTVMTEGFQVPMVAYMLDVPTMRVQAPPAVAGTGAPPNVIFQAAAQRDSRLLPIIRPWHVGYSLVDRTPTFRVFMDCAAKANM